MLKLLNLLRKGENNRLDLLAPSIMSKSYKQNEVSNQQRDCKWLWYKYWLRNELKINWPDNIECILIFLFFKIKKKKKNLCIPQIIKQYELTIHIEKSWKICFWDSQIMYQKWMKTRPRLKALDMYENGYDMIKGSAKSICRTIHHQGLNKWTP